jgi:hypothetical protein
LRLGAVVLVLAACLAACSGPPRILRERNLGSDEVLDLVASRNRAITTLRGDGSITLETPERSVNGGFDLDLRKPDSALVLFHGPFGIKVGTLALSRERFVFYNALENTAFVGPADSGTLGAMFNIQIRFDEIINAFTGEFGATTLSDTLTRFGVENNDYVVLYRGPEGTKEYRVDGDAFVVTSYRLSDIAGKEIVRATASEIEPGEANAMPRFVRIVFPADRRSITVTYDDVVVNDTVNCAYELPDQARIVHHE